MSAIKIPFTTIKLVNLHNFTEERLITLNDKEAYDLRIVGKAKFNSKERKVTLKLVKELLKLDHPNIVKLDNFYMT